MILRELIHNISLILVLGVLYSFLYRRLDKLSLYFKILSGILFGIIAILGMIVPLHLLPGIIFDGRSIIISIAGFFGGIIPAAIAVVMAGIYRTYIGGDGALMGVLVIISSAGIGTFYHWLRSRSRNITGIIHLYIFSLLVHGTMLLCILALPAGVQQGVFTNIALPVITLYPVASVIICRILLDQEKRIQDEKERVILLKEIHHRVKNNMQVISSLLNLQKNSIQDNYARELLDSSITRVLSMAMVHERLYKSGNLSYINFKDYVLDLTSGIFDTLKISHNTIAITTDIDDISLDIDKAIPCGLIINELVSNSLKHAFHSNIDGKIIIEFSITRDQKCKLVVRDNGVGLPASLTVESTRTLGMQLVRSLAQQLDGSLDISINNGTTAIVEFPLK